MNILQIIKVNLDTVLIILYDVIQFARFGALCTIISVSTVLN